MNSVIQKKLMAFAGSFWLLYLLIHMLANLQFFSGKQNFNGFYDWFNNSIILYFVISALLLIALLFHVYSALSRQLDSNRKRSIAYKKSYPKAVPRWIAWSGAGLLLTFIIFHVIQMLTADDLYVNVEQVFHQPIMWMVYGLGLLALSTHLHHGLNNVTQTFGLSHRQNQMLVFVILTLLIGGFISVPLAVIFSLI